MRDPVLLPHSRAPSAEDVTGTTGAVALGGGNFGSVWHLTAVWICPDMLGRLVSHRKGQSVSGRGPKDPDRRGSAPAPF